jgi:alanine dehydrogenase
MIISVPKEIKEQEFRVALAPSAAYQLIKRGHRVVVEREAGAGAGFPDADYVAAGATIVKDHAAAFAEGELIVKVRSRRPQNVRSCAPAKSFSLTCILRPTVHSPKLCSSPA